MAASGQVGRIGVNLNQAVAALNASGQNPGTLERYAHFCARMVAKLDRAASDVVKKLP